MLRNNPLTYEVVGTSSRAQLCDQGGYETLVSCSKLGRRISWPEFNGRTQSAALTWAADWTPDSVLNRAILYPSSTLVGGLIDQSGTAATAISIVAKPTGSSTTFDPRKIFVALLRDVDETNYESPPDLGLGLGPIATPFLGAPPGFAVPIYRALITVAASWAPAFRVWFAGAADLGAGVNISVSVKQA